MTTETITTDVLVIGSGPVGAAFARAMTEGGRRVLMVDAGPQLSARPGAHLKNSYVYQRNVDLFTPVIKAHLATVSMPVNAQPELALDPAACRTDLAKFREFVTCTQNPLQRPELNLPAAAATYAVGGMATHWTGATPRHHPEIERCALLTPEEWDLFYSRAEELLGTRTDVFSGSVRHELVRDALLAEYPDLPTLYGVQDLPMAVRRRTDNPALVHWTGTDDVFGPLADGKTDGFDLRPEHLCLRLGVSADGRQVEFAEIRDLTRWLAFRVEADCYFVACGAIATPQLLYASGIRPAALGRYLNEQPMAFCQVVMNQWLIDQIGADPRFAEQTKRRLAERPGDPRAELAEDPEPNVWIPVSEGRPWHCQIHRDAFHYGDVAPHIDPRLVVDLRWFGMVEPRAENRVTFCDDHPDLFGMPQATFEFALTMADRQSQHEMMRDMLRAAGALGGFLPGSEPRFVAPGLPLHVAGTTRMGRDPETSVCDADSRVWGFGNLYLGGNGLIPHASASNPTLTSVAVALKAAWEVLRGQTENQTEVEDGVCTRCSPNRNHRELLAQR